MSWTPPRTIDLQIQDVLLEFAKSTKQDKYVTAIAKIKALVVESLPKTQSIVTLTEPPLGVDRLWLEGRDYGVTAGYNQCLGEIRSIWR